MAATDELSELRSLLVGPERSALDELRHRLDDPELRAEDVGRVLAEAIVLRARQDDDLRRALQPLIVDALKQAIAREPDFVADAIFPIIGPAIRRAVAESLRGLVQSLNEVVSNTFSVRGLRWRLEAWRTGRPFGEVVLAHSLVHRVEQVLLIHRRTSLPLVTATAPDVRAQDEALVAGMIGAIQDFVRDAFRGDDGAALHASTVGDLTLWAEPGPEAILVAVIRGTPPEELRTTLRGANETVHRRLGRELAAFDGDPAALEPARPLLEDCLTSDYSGRGRR